MLKPFVVHSVVDGYLSKSNAAVVITIENV